MIEIVINPDYCKGCSICIAICPKKVLQASQHINSKGYVLPEAVNIEACTQCKLCEIECPDFAIAVTDKQTKKEENNA